MQNSALFGRSNFHRRQTGKCCDQVSCLSSSLPPTAGDVSCRGAHAHGRKYSKAFCDGLLLEMSAVVAAHGWRYQLSPATHSWPCICCGQPLLEMSTVAAAYYWRFQCSHGFPMLEISCHGCRPLEMPPLLGLSTIMAIDCLCQLSLPPTVRDFKSIFAPHC